MRCYRIRTQTCVPRPRQSMTLFAPGNSKSGAASISSLIAVPSRHLIVGAVILRTRFPEAQRQIRKFPCGAFRTERMNCSFRLISEGEGVRISDAWVKQNQLCHRFFVGNTKWQLHEKSGAAERSTRPAFSMSGGDRN